MSHKLDSVFSWNILSDVPETIANLRVRWITDMIGTRTVDFVSKKLKSNQLIAGSVLRKVFRIRRGTNIIMFVGVLFSFLREISMLWNMFNTIFATIVAYLPPQPSTFWSLQITKVHRLRRKTEKRRRVKSFASSNRPRLLKFREIFVGFLG